MAQTNSTAIHAQKVEEIIKPLDGSETSASESAEADKQTATSVLPTLLVSLIGLIVLSVLAASYVTFPFNRSSITIGIIIFSFFGVYPLTYVAYHAFRENAQRNRLRNDFRLLGLVSEDELEETVDSLYLTVYSPTQFFVYIFLIIVFCIVIFIGYLNQVELNTSEKIVMNLVFFSFLGAYIYSIQELVRRYNTFDIRPQVFSSIFMRMVVATILAFVGSAVIQLSGAQLVSQTENNSAASSWAMILAFVIGIFPSRGIRWFTQRTNDLLKTANNLSSQRPLERLIGVSTWHEGRLAEMGIDDAQNLATTDIRRLLLTTQFDTQEIIHWIDQAILYVKVGDKFERFCDSKIASFSELRAVMQNLSIDSLKNLGSDAIQSRTETRKRLASVLGLVDVDELERLCDYSNYPNYIHIAEFYSRTATVARQRANLAMDILLGEVDETNFQAVITDGEQLLIQNPNDPRLLLRLGTAYYEAGRLDAAYNACTKAIQLDPDLAQAYHSRSIVLADRGEFEKAVRDATDSINIDSTNARAYNNRGYAYLQMGYFDRAIDDFDKSLDLDDRFAKAYSNRGIVYNAIGDFENAHKDFEKAYLLGYRSASLWVGWGNALLGLKHYDDAVVKLSQAVLYDADLATAHAKRGYAYLMLGSQYDFQARRDLEAAIKMNASSFAAYANLGLLESRNNNFSQAVKYYDNALAIDEGQYSIRLNLATAYYAQKDLEKAKQEFDLILKAAPNDSFEAKQASLYLMKIAAERTGNDS